ncbi:MAG TPA: LysM domain-containing protein [Candidatus Limnocylindrales bacterium]|nr:LysM domain-containing protein [Candidatus Limnocylindrales bacterium]
MTAVDPDHRPSAAVPDPVVDRTLSRMCPYLVAADGLWRSSTVAREHRCGAVAPPALLAAEKQRRLCLTADHLTCPTFEAARAARPIGPDREPTLPRPLARATPMVLDHGRIAITVPAFRSERSVGQAALIVLMAVAFALIVFAKLSGGNSPAGAADASASPPASAHASAPSGSAHPTSAASSAPSGAPSGLAAGSADPGGSASPAATAKPASQTYKVKAGDTLIGIAAKFGTTPKAIAKLNGITNTANLHVGQVLKIP